MDLTSILPLLMQRGNSSDGGTNDMLMEMLLKGKGNDPSAALLKEMLAKNSGGRGAQAHAGKPNGGNGSSNGANGGNADLFAQLLRAQNGGGNNADMMSMLYNLMQSRAKTNAVAPSPQGLAPILLIADNEILGKLTRYFSKKKGL